jgi:hypothetical protein
VTHGLAFAVARAIDADAPRHNLLGYLVTNRARCCAVLVLVPASLPPHDQEHDARLMAWRAFAPGRRYAMAS